MDNEILIGIFTLVGTLSGIIITNLFKSKEEKRRRQADYALSTFAPLRTQATNMELTARHILFTLTSLRLGASKSQKKMISKSLAKIEESLATSQCLPEILDEKLVEVWSEVSNDFGALLVTYSIESPSLIPSPFSDRPPRSVFLRKYQEIFTANDFTALSKEIAPDDESKAIFDSATKLISSLLKLRKEITRLSTEGYK